MFKHPVYRTIIVSLVFVSISITYLIWNKDSIFHWTEPTAELRNVVLGLVAIGGIPFLVYGHINRRNDIEEKRKDYLFRNESMTCQMLMDEVHNTSMLFRKALDTENMDFPGENNPVSIDRKTFEDYLGGILTERNNPDAWNKRGEWMNALLGTSGWRTLTQCCVAIAQTNRTISKFQNKELGDLIRFKMMSNFEEKELLLLYLIAVLMEFPTPRNIWEETNVLELQRLFMAMAYGGALSRDFERDIDDIRVNILGEKERAYYPPA